MKEFYDQDLLNDVREKYATVENTYFVFYGVRLFEKPHKINKEHETGIEKFNELVERAYLEGNEAIYIKFYRKENLMLNQLLETTIRINSIFKNAVCPYIESC